MGTPAIIGVKTGSTVTYCSVNHDGYLEEAGMKLLKYHNSEELARALIAGGDMSSVQQYTTCPEGHSFNNRVPEHIVYYARDRKDGYEYSHKAQTGTVNSFLHFSQLIDAYLFDDGIWYKVQMEEFINGVFIKFPERFSFKPLSDCLNETA